MEDNINKTIFCTGCDAELPEGLKFCTSCGKPIKQTFTDNLQETRPDQKIICPNCAKGVSPENKFCTDCGAMIHQTQSNTCPNCHADVSPDLRFCTECGKELDNSSANQSTCPNCFAEVEPGLKFCTECGSSLERKVKPTNENITKELQKRRKNYKTAHSDDEPLDSAIETTKDLMEGFGGFLYRASSSLESNLNKLGESSGPKSRSGTPRIQKPIKQANDNPGYLICDSCGGYYQLKQGETAEGFFDECECGGRFKHHRTLPDNLKE